MLPAICHLGQCLTCACRVLSGVVDQTSSNLYFPEDRKTKGVTCVLSGMRRPNYGDDSLGALRSPAFDVDLHLYEAFAHM